MISEHTTGTFNFDDKTVRVVSVIELDVNRFAKAALVHGTVRPTRVLIESAAGGTSVAIPSAESGARPD